jgi:hypothetical protein
MIFRCEAAASGWREPAEVRRYRLLKTTLALTVKSSYP